MTFDKALYEAEVEIVPPDVEQSGVRIHIDGKTVTMGDLSTAVDPKVGEGLKAAIKEVYGYVNNKIKKLDAFQLDQQPVDVTFKADGTTILRPDRPIEYQGKKYSEFSYKLKNTAALQAVQQVGAK